jgi:hypothetical protein
LEWKKGKEVIPGCLEADLSTARKHFFLKKEAKTFARLAYALGQRERLIIKSFLVLFHCCPVKS